MNQEHVPLIHHENVLKKKPSSWYAIFPMFLVAFSGGALYAPHVQFYTQVFCNIYYQSEQEQIPFKNCAIPPIQKLVSRAQAIIMFLTCASTLIGAGYYGRLSDRKGRRLIIRISTMGSLIYVVCDLLTAKYHETIGITLLFLGPLIRGIMAGESILMASVQAYIADTTDPSSRTVVFARLMASLFIGSAIGPFVSSLILKHTEDLVNVFYVAFIVDILNVLYTLFILPESNTDSRNETNDNKTYNIFSGLKLIFNEKPKISTISRYALPCLVLSEFLLTLVKRPPTLLYAMLKFHWTAYEGSLYYTCTSILKLLMMVGLLPLLSGLFQKKCPVAHHTQHEKRFKNSVPFDVWMVRIGIGIDAICLLLAGLAKHVVLFTIAGMLQSFSMLAQPSIRGLITSCVNPNQVGELLGAIAILDSIAMIISHLSINTIYSASVNQMPELIFYVCSGIALCSCICSFMIKTRQKISSSLIICT